MLMNPQRFAHRSSDRNDGSISSRLTLPKLHLATLNAALFSFDPESLTLASPLEMSEANALSVATSLCSSGVVTTPLFSSCFLVLGLLTKLSRTAAFLAGEAGRVVFTLSVACFFFTSCSEMRRPRPEFLPHSSPVCVFHDIFGLSLLSVLWLKLSWLEQNLG